MVGVTASVLIGVMDPLLARLSAILEREHAKIKCVHRQIVFLRDELSSMSAALETMSESEEENPQVKEWMSQLRDLSYDVEDCIEIFIMHCLGNVDTSDGFIHKIINKVTTLKAHYHIGNQIDELKERALEVNGRRKRYKLDPSASSQRSPVIDPRLPALFEETHRLVGIDTQMDKLVMWLVDGIDSHPQRKVVSIAGLGGLGKTTLANQVFHKIRSQFDCTAFVSVTRSPNVSKVLSDTLVQFLKSSSSPNFAPQHNTSPNNRHSTANFLPHYLKICFLHLSIFPEDHVIGRLCLIRRWIAEGLIAEQRGQHLEDTALRSLQIFTAEYPEETLIISPGGFQHLEDFHFRPSMYVA